MSYHQRARILKNLIAAYGTYEAMQMLLYLYDSRRESEWHLGRVFNIGKRKYGQQAAGPPLNRYAWLYTTASILLGLKVVGEQPDLADGAYDSAFYFGLISLASKWMSNNRRQGGIARYDGWHDLYMMKYGDDVP